MSGGCVSEPGARRCTHPAARSARNGFGERGVQSRRLKPVGWGSGSLGVRTRACDAGKCVRRLAACVPLPGSSAHVSRCSGLRDHCPPSTPRRLGKWGVGQGAGGGLLPAPGAATFPSNGCDDAFNSVRAGRPRACLPGAPPRSPREPRLGGSGCGVLRGRRSAQGFPVCVSLPWTDGIGPALAGGSRGADQDDPVAGLQLGSAGGEELAI